MTCVRIEGGRLAAFIGLLCLGLGVAFAQLVPPDDYFEWSGAGGNGLWTTGTNWIGGPNNTGGQPTIDADVFFANEPTEDTYAGQGYGYQSPLTVTAPSTDTRVNSLWFETGRDYTLNGSGRWLVLGRALAHDGQSIITGLNTDASAWQSEHNINAPIYVQLPNADWTATIASYSAGGIRIGRLYFATGNLRQRGGGAMHIAGALTGTTANPGNLTIATDAGHMILSGNNQNWRGQLTVNHGFLVATVNNALGSTTTVTGGVRRVSINGNSSGSTLAFRPKFVGAGLNNSAGIDYSTGQAITVSGMGFQRPWGSQDPYDPYSALNLSPVGAVYNDGGNNTFAGNIMMVGNTWFGSRHGVLTLTGRVSQPTATVPGQPLGNYTFTKVGHGVVALGYNGTNTWRGSTVIREGVLRLGHANSLPGTVVRFEGGLLELGAGDFARTLGTTGNNRINWQAGRDGGFSAFGGERTVTLNSGSALTWGSGGFVGNGAALLLSSAYADNKITFANPINLYVPNVGSAIREIRVERGATSAAHAVLSGQISSPRGGILKTGLGTLWLSNSSNSYAQATVIREGVLSGYVHGFSRIDFDGGVLGIDANFSRTLGASGTNRIRWLAGRDGGFASYSGTRTVTLGSAGSVVTVGYIGEGHFVNADRYLIFGAYDASGTVAFNNKLGLFSEFNPLGWGPNRIRVIKGTTIMGDSLAMPAASVVFSHAFETPPGPPGSRSTSYSLYFEGDGRADITQAHTLETNGADLVTGWVGQFVKVRGAHLVLRDQGNIPLALTTAAAAKVEAYHGGSITLDNRMQYVANRINDVLDVGLHSGKFTLVGNPSIHVTETVNDLKLNLGANTVSLLADVPLIRPPTVSTRSVSLLFNKLELVNSYWDFDIGATVQERPTINFTSNNASGFSGYNAGGANAHRLSFATKPTEIGGILPYATVNGRDWARTVLGGGRYYLTAYTGYETNNQTTWTANTVNAAPSSNQIVNATRSVNSLKLESGRTVTIQNGNNVSLSVFNGILSIGSATTKIQGGSLSLGPSTYVHVYNTPSVGLDISSSISIPGRALVSPTFVKTGPGTLLLSGNTGVNLNTFFGGSGTIYIHEGTLALSKTGTGRVNVGSIIVGDHAGVDVLRLDNHQQIVSTVNLTLRGGHPDPARFLMAEGILRYNGINGSGVGIRQTINNLHIEGRGVIDFRGGEVGRANFLIINGNITFGEDSKLFIRNWYEYEDYILIRRNGAGLVNLDNIVFEGYGPAIFRPWDGNYYIITAMPESSTYGAILGVVGLGLVVWRRKAQRKD